MTIAIAGIQARMGSSRLPGKSLADLAGKPMLQRVIERANAAHSLDAVVVLTSTSPLDDAIANFCREVGFECRRGSETDVMSRYIDLVDEFNADYLVRITGDCPLISPEHIDFQLDALRAKDADFTCLSPGKTSTVLEGQGAMSVRALRRAAQSQDPRDREHVGSFFFVSHNEEFRHVELHPPDYFLRTDVRLAVDQPQDLEFIRAIFEQFAPNHGSLVPLEEVLRWLLINPSLLAMNQAVQNSAETSRAHDLRGQLQFEPVGHWPES